MRKFVISENEKSRILLLYEQKVSPDVSDATKVQTQFKQKLPDYKEQLSTDAIILDVMNEALTGAKNWWINWLKDPTTIQKFYNIRNIKSPSNDQLAMRKKIWDEYFKILNKITYKLEKCNIETLGVKGYVRDDHSFVVHIVPCTTMKMGEYVKVFLQKTKFYYNTEEFKKDINFNDLKNTIVHEIQHLLHYYEPLNPEGKLINLGGNKTNVKFVNTGNKKESKIPKTKSSSTTFTVNPNLTKYFATSAMGIQKLWKQRLKENYGKLEYIKNPNEMYSRISAIRKLLNLKPEQNITVSMIKPYILGQKEETNMFWILVYWTYKGFPDITKFLNDINMLAKTNLKNTKNIT